MVTLSIDGIILTISSIIRSIYQHGKNAEHIRGDISKLSDELFALKGILEHVQTRKRDFPTLSRILELFGSEDFLQVLKSTDQFLWILLRNIRHLIIRERLDLDRPWRSIEFGTDIQRLETVKTWFITSMMSDDRATASSLYAKIRGLTETIPIMSPDPPARGYWARGAMGSLWVPWNPDDPVMTREGILGRLPGFCPDTLHSKARGAGEPGRGSWFLDGPLADWFEGKQGSGRVLWLRGESDVRRRALFAQSVERAIGFAKQNEYNNAAYFYCSATDMASLEPKSILGSLVIQLANQRSYILEDPGALSALRLSSPSQSLESIPFLEEILLRHVTIKSMIVFPNRAPSGPISTKRVFPKAFIFIDSIDECADAGIVVSVLARVAGKVDTVRLLVTSRAGIPGSTEFQGIGCTEVEMKPGFMQQDINAF